MNITVKKLTEIKPYEKNPRKNDAAVDAVAESIRQFGWKVPIVIDKNGIIVTGHTRYKAAKKLGLTEVPCIVADDLNDAQIKAYRLADNKVAEIAEWDEELLWNELQELADMDVSMDVFGFEPFDIEDDNVEAEEDYYEPELPQQPKAKRGDIYQLGNHRLMCGDCTDENDVDALTDGEEMDLCVTDPPYNVNYGDKASMLEDYDKGHRNTNHILNDHMENNEFYNFLYEFYTQMLRSLKAGGAFYIWHAESEGVNFRVALQDAGGQVRQCLIWNKNALVLSRQDYHWKHEPCQPAGTMVRTPNGEVPIEELKDGDRVLSYDKNAGAIKGFKEGVPIKTAQRYYKGTLYGVTVGNKTTWATDNHRFTVRFKNAARKQYCVYLMRRGDWWRVGITETYNSRGFGLKQRMRQENGEDAWIIDTFKTRGEAQCAEQLISVKYGIPYTHWEIERGFKERKHEFRTTEQIKWIYDNLDLNLLKENAKRLLEAYNRHVEYPFITKETQAHHLSCRVTTDVRACNIVPEIMEIPVPYKKYKGTNKTFEWETITEVQHKEHDGQVYSLQVEKYEHYVADGIVTHNCLYGWKDGAGHYFIDDRSQTTVFEDKIDVDKLTKEEMKQILKDIFEDKVSTTVMNEAKPTVNDLHPTMKPIKLIARLVKNSSRKGEKVIDFFGGSGSTLIACEQLGRSCYMMELDEKYISVIIDRWEQLTGKKAIKIKKG